MKVFAQLSKVDVEKRLVYGRAAQETPDHSGEIMDYEQSKPNFVKWSGEMSKATNGASQGNVRAMHGAVAVGKLMELNFNDDEHAIDVVAKIIDNNEWEKVLEGVYTGFSIGGKYGARVKKGEFTHYEALPTEISLVDRPCIPTATFFDIQKADGSVMQKKFQTPTEGLTKGIPDMPAKPADIEYEVIGTPEEADALAKMLSENKLSIGDAVKAVAKMITPHWGTEIKKSIEVPDLQLVKIQMELSRSGYDYETLSKITTREELDALQLLEKLAPFADPENSKYPIDNAAQVKAAWNYINMEKNSSKYTPEKLAVIKKSISDAWTDKVDSAGAPVEKMAKGGPGSGTQGGGKTGNAGSTEAHMAASVENAKKQIEDAKVHLGHQLKEHGVEEALANTAFNIGSKMANVAAEQHGLKGYTTSTKDFTPGRGVVVYKDGEPVKGGKTGKSEQAGDLQKGVNDVSQLGDTLQSLYYLACGAVREAASEGDNSPIPARLKQVVLDIAGIYKDMAVEEADELLEELYSNENPVPEIMQMAYGLAGSLAKAGARNSAGDKEMLQKMHDLTCSLGANCSNMDLPPASNAGLGLDTKDSATGTNIQMAQAEGAGDLIKALPAEDVLAKMLEPLNKALGAALEKIARLEAQPLPAKGVLRVVGKENDLVVDVKKVEISPVIERDGSENAVASALKKIHATGGAPLIGMAHSKI